MIRDLVIRNRSYRRFREDETIDRQTLMELVDLARLSASAANLQPLNYVITNSPEMCSQVFPTLSWAGYLKDWDGPSQGERPAAYITILADSGISRNVGCDHGIAAQSILLGAVEKGLGGCMIGSIDRNVLRTVLAIPEQLEILLVIALGRPTEEVLLATVGPDGSIKYFRDENGVHHVPKRKLEDVLVD